MLERSFLFLPISFLFSTGILLSLACHRCSTSKANSVSDTLTSFVIPYATDLPDERYLLTDPNLQEISGLSVTSTPGVFAAVSDERGEIYWLDIQNKAAIQQKILFKEKGDFEGIEAVNDTIYCIKSDGDLYEVSNWRNNGTPTINTYKLDLDPHDIEGLCYDKKRNALLVAAKEDPESAVKRAIWSFDLNLKKRSEQPVLWLEPSQVDRIVPNDDDNKQRYFSTSGLAVHPITGDIYLISTALKRLAVIDYTTGDVKAAVRLNKDILGQPEGVTFDASGNLYISSEAKKSEAMIVKFNFKRT